MFILRRSLFFVAAPVFLNCAVSLLRAKQSGNRFIWEEKLEIRPVFAFLCVLGAGLALESASAYLLLALFWVAAAIIPVMNRPVFKRKQDLMLLVGSAVLYAAVYIKSLRVLYDCSMKDTVSFSQYRLRFLVFLMVSGVFDYCILSIGNNLLGRLRGSGENEDSSAMRKSAATFRALFLTALVYYLVHRLFDMPHIWSSEVYALNGLIMMPFLMVPVYLLGDGLGGCIDALIILFLAGANYIKISYHNTWFTWFDLLQVKELYLIGREFLTPMILAAIAVTLAVCAALIIRFRKQVLRALRPHVRIVPAVLAGIIAFGLTSQVRGIRFKEMGVYPRTWENERINVRYNGVIANLIFNYELVKKAVMAEPEGYGPEEAEKLKQQFAGIPHAEEQEKPDVILILAESLFDLEDVPGLEISEDIDAVLDAHEETSLISPRYGGYTSAIEFETLSGLTLAFMPESLTPYTTYFHNASDEFPCVVREFAADGYGTKVLHPNLPEFYNRTTVYKSMGFQEYLSILDFERKPERMTENGWLMDDALADKMIEQLEKEEAPQFMFAITMEEHFVNQEKYKDPEIRVTSDQLTDAELEVLTQQAVSYSHTDAMMKKLMDYIDHAERPTLLYVFGDHLPPVNALETMGYLDNKYNKYRTRFFTYSNYKTITTGQELMSPNYVAVQMLEDAAIPHSGYWDYLYEQRKQIPIVHKEFIDANDPQLDIYRWIQYDILFGKHYLAEWK